MRLSKLRLKAFRNIREIEWTPSPDVNFVLGENGQGKTTLLEAIGYISGLRSFRGAKNPDVIQWGQSEAEIIGTLQGEGDHSSEKSEWVTELKVRFIKSDKATDRVNKSAWINGKSYKSSTLYLSQRFGSHEMGFHSISFNPSDHELVRGDPAGRRAYIDRALSAENAAYLEILTRYSRLLDQRNQLLKNSPQVSRDHLVGFTEPLAPLAAEIYLRRAIWLSEASQRASKIQNQIAPAQLPLSLQLQSNWVDHETENFIKNNQLLLGHFPGHQSQPSLDLLANSFRKYWALSEGAERKVGHTLVGPHRDDWTFLLGESPLKGHGSQGEVRSALLSLKLAAVEQFKRATGHKPVFLLDDFSSELDESRRRFLMKFLTESQMQVFVTVTEDQLAQGQRYRLRDGQMDALA